MIKKVLACILGTTDLVLLVIIVISAATGWRINPSSDTLQTTSQPETVSSQPETVSSQPEAVSSQPEAVSSQSEAVSSQPEAVSSQPEAVSSQPETVSSQPEAVSSQPEAVSSQPEAVSSQPEAVSSQPETVSSQPEASVTVRIPDPDTVSSNGYASLSDIAGYTYPAGWTISGDAAKLTELYSVSGGWKAYMLCDPENKRGSSMDKTLNLNIGIGQSGVIVTANWYGIYFNNTGEWIDDSTPDSVFQGEWKDGSISATGSGRIVLHDFRCDNGRETASGEMILPDGTEAVIALVRP